MLSDIGLVNAPNNSEVAIEIDQIAIQNQQQFQISCIFGESPSTIWIGNSSWRKQYLGKLTELKTGGRERQFVKPKTNYFNSFLGI